MAKQNDPNTPWIAIEERQLSARLYTSRGESSPMLAMIADVPYVRAVDQDSTALYLKTLDLEAELLELVPQQDRDTAEKILLLISDIQSERRQLLSEQIEEQLTGLLPRHAPIIRSFFDPEDGGLPLEEIARHIRCSLAPARILASKGGAR